MRYALLLLVACAPSAAEIERHNTTALDRATQRSANGVTPFTPGTVSVADLADPSAPRGAGAVVAHVSRAADPHALLGAEHIGALDDGRMVFLGRYCVETRPCSDQCAEYASYSYGKALDGHIVITRTYPRRVAVAEHGNASCPATCGGIPRAGPGSDPGASTAGVVLGNVLPRQIELRDNGYRVEYVDRRCTNMTPVP